MSLSSPTDIPPNVGAAGPRRRPALYAAGLAAAVLLAALALFYWHRFSTRESTDDAFVEAHVVAVAAQVGGTVKTVNVESNQAVAAGDVLVEIDRRDFELEVARAEADLAAAEAGLAAAGARVPVATLRSSSGLASGTASVARARAAEAAAGDAIAAAEARLVAAEARAQRARQDVERLRGLIAKDEVSREEYEHSQSAAAAAEAAVAEARQEALGARNRRLEAAAGIEQARAASQEAAAGPQQVAASQAEERVAAARVAQLRAALALAKAALDDTTLRAPQAGVVGRRNVEPGQSVSAGQPLVAIVPPEVWITANFKETQLAKMRPGQPAIIHVDAYGTDLRGHVESLGAATGSSFSLLPASNASGNFVKVVQRVPVRIVVDEAPDPLRPLRPGMSVVPTVITG